MVPWDRDRLPTLHGSIPPKPGETLDASHIQNYWQQHVGSSRPASTPSGPTKATGSTSSSASSGISSITRARSRRRPNVRPWSLQRNGYPGIAQWGGWVWSGDTESVVEDARGADRRRPQLLAEHRSVLGLGHRRLLSERELTGELYARWYPVRGVLRIVPLARPHVVDAPAVGLGAERHGPAREQQHQHADPAGRSRATSCSRR